VTGFTLGNISVVGTYYTHALNLTPRGLLAVTVADTVADGLHSALYRTVRRSDGLGSPSGTGDPCNNYLTLINKPPNDKAKALRPSDPRPRLQGSTA
jgi:hypothetical protein